MESYKYLIVGGGIAGVTAAETIRQTDKDGSLAIISDETYPLYSRVMLSKPPFFLGKIPFESIYMKGPGWYAKNHIAYLAGKTATALLPAEKILTLSDGSEIKYEKLLLALGVAARTWAVPGAEKKGVHYLRTLDQGRGVIEAIKTAKRAIIIGGGFIGFETADLLRLAGLEATMLIREKYFWEPLLDEKSGQMVEAALLRTGVSIMRETEVAEVLGTDVVSGVRLKNGQELSCDMIMCGIGVFSPLDWLKDSGMKFGRGIIANEYLATNIPGIWTAGDVAEYRDILLEETLELGNWANAREQGRVA
ncbi:MAG: FAD-dependent oxidoreductase, partial [Patescibacteria group bacterium]